MRASVDRISRHVSALHRLNALLEENVIPISKNLKVKDLQVTSDYLRHMRETLRNPNRIPGEKGIEMKVENFPPSRLQKISKSADCQASRGEYQKH